MVEGQLAVLQEGLKTIKKKMIKDIYTEIHITDEQDSLVFTCPHIKLTTVLSYSNMEENDDCIITIWQVTKTRKN